jgi:hypothetical protein
VLVVEYHKLVGPDMSETAVGLGSVQLKTAKWNTGRAEGKVCGLFVGLVHETFAGAAIEVSDCIFASSKLRAPLLRLLDAKRHYDQLAVLGSRKKVS